MYAQILKDGPFLQPATQSAREQMHTAVSTLTAVESQIVGYSICHRPLWMYKFGKGRGRVVFFGAHHALESITTNLLYAFIYILNGRNRSLITRENDPSLLLSLYTYYVIPCLNPDGIEIRYSGDPTSPLYDRIKRLTDGDLTHWQANARGVDLNHNYDYGFAEYKRIEAERKISSGPSLYSGEYPESEPETRLAASLVRILQPAFVVSLHSQGEQIFYSPSSSLPVARRLSRLTGYTVALPGDTAAYGGLCDYTGYSLGIPSFTYELGRGENPLSESLLPDLVARVCPSLALLPMLK